VGLGCDWREVRPWDLHVPDPRRIDNRAADRRRDRANRCAYCDYDLSGHSAEQPPVCPECGVPFDGYASKRKRYVSSTEVREALAARQEALRCEFTDPERSAEITRRISALIDAKAIDPDAPPRSAKANPTEPGPV
jgi:hypothetical protein